MIVTTYQRVSSQGQVDGDGFLRQSQAILEFCYTHKLIVEKSFREEGVSGTVEGLNRRAFAELLSYFSSVPVSETRIVVVERMDRLARDLMVQEVMLAECRRRNIQVYAADRGELVDVASNDGDPTRKLIRQIMGALAEWEKTMIVHKLRGARERIRMSGKKCDGRKQYGITALEKANLEFIFTLRADGWSWRKISNQLNLGGSVMRNKKPWTFGSVQSVYRYETARRLKAKTAVVTPPQPAHP